MDIPKIMLKFVNSHISVTIVTSFVYFWIFLFCKSDVYALMPLFVSWLCCETWFVAMMELCWFPKRFSYRKTSGVSFLARLQDQSLTWFFVGFSAKILSRTVCDGGLLWFRKFLRDRKRPPFPTLQSTYLQRQQLTCKARLLWELWTWEKTFMIQCLTGSWNLSQNLSRSSLQASDTICSQKRNHIQSHIPQVISSAHQPQTFSQPKLQQ